MYALRYEVRPILLSLSLYLEVFPLHEYNTSLIVLDITALNLLLELTAILIIMPSYENEYALCYIMMGISPLVIYQNSEFIQLVKSNTLPDNPDTHPS
jgi:hypothetical protein